MPTRRMPTFEIVHPVPVCTGVWKREINVKIKSGLNPEFQRRSGAARAALYWRARGSVSATRAAGLNFRLRDGLGTPQISLDSLKIIRKSQNRARVTQNFRLRRAQGRVRASPATGSRVRPTAKSRAKPSNLEKNRDVRAHRSPRTSDLRAVVCAPPPGVSDRRSGGARQGELCVRVQTYT